MNQQFRRKPAPVEAIQFTGDNMRAVWEFLHGTPPRSEFNQHYYTVAVGDFGDYATVGDWIIRRPNGQLAVEKPNTFASTYEPVDDSQIRRFVGWLSGDVPELHNVEVPRLAESLERFLVADAEAPAEVAS